MTALQKWFSPLVGFLGKHFSIFEPTAEVLALTRILFCTCLLMTEQTHFSSIAAFDPMFYNPPPRLSFLPMSFDLSFWKSIDFLIPFCLFMVLFGFLTSFFSISLFALSVFGFSKLYAFGKIDHNFFTVLCPLLLGWAGWGAKWSVDSLMFKNLKTRNWPVNYMAFCLGLAFLTAALPKIAGGWLKFDLMMSKGFIAKKVMYEGIENPLASWLIEKDWPFFFKFLDFSTIAIEIMFILLIFHKKFSVWVMFSVCLFHVGVLFLMNINFGGHMLAYLPLIFCFFQHKASLFKPSLKWMILGVLILVLNFFGYHIFWVTAFSLLACYLSVLKSHETSRTATSL